MADKAKILLLVGGAHYHDQPSHRRALLDMLEPGFDVTMSGYPNVLTPENLAAYDAIVDYTSWWEPAREQYVALLRAVMEGKGYAAFHCGATFMNSPAYHDMIGATFVYHDPKQTCKVEFKEKKHTNGRVEDNWIVHRDLTMVRPEHPATDGIEDFEVFDELFLVTGDMTHCRILARAEAHPVVWTKRYGSGRVFCTVLGHDEVSLTNAGVKAVCVQGVEWAAGLR